MSELKESTVPGSVYEHYKGNIYVFLHEISDHVTGGTSVVLETTTISYGTAVYMNFFGKIEIDGKQVPTFRYTGQVLPV